MIKLPPYYIIYGFSPYQNDICEILNENGYAHICEREVAHQNQTSKWSPQDLFIISTEENIPLKFKQYSPFNLYKILDWPERQVKYSGDEIENLTDMLYGDSDTCQLALTIFSKINIIYVDACLPNIRDGFNRQHNERVYKYIVNPYLSMLKNHVNIILNFKGKIK